MNQLEYTPLPHASPQEELRKALASLKEWEHFSENDIYLASEVFMDKLGHLYLDYFQYHIEEGQLIGMEFKELLYWATPLISRWYVDQGYLDFFRKEAWDGLWHQVCWMASTITAFYEMFGYLGVQFSDMYFWEFINEHLNAHVEKEEIPKDMPFSHSWWYKDFYDLKGQAEMIDKKDN